MTVSAERILPRQNSFLGKKSFCLSSNVAELPAYICNFHHIKSREALIEKNPLILWNKSIYSQMKVNNKTALDVRWRVLVFSTYYLT